MDYVTNASMNCRNKMSYWIVVIVGVLFLLVINVGKSLIFAIIGLFFDQSFLKMASSYLRLKFSYWSIIVPSLHTILIAKIVHCIAKRFVLEE